MDRGAVHTEWNWGIHIWPSIDFSVRCLPSSWCMPWTQEQNTRSSHWSPGQQFHRTLSLGHRPWEKSFERPFRFICSFVCVVYIVCWPLRGYQPKYLRWPALQMRPLSPNPYLRVITCYGNYGADIFLTGKGEWRHSFTRSFPRVYEGSIIVHEGAEMKTFKTTTTATKQQKTNQFFYTSYLARSLYTH